MSVNSSDEESDVGDWVNVSSDEESESESEKSEDNDDMDDDCSDVSNGGKTKWKSKQDEDWETIKSEVDDYAKLKNIPKDAT